MVLRIWNYGGMDNFLMSRGRPQEPVRLTSGEESVLSWLYLKVGMVWVSVLRWWWTPVAYEHLMLQPCLLESMSFMSYYLALQQ